MPAKALFIGLDSAESTLLAQWMEEGRLPALRALRERGREYRVRNCWEALPAAVWSELTTGRSPGQIGLYYPPRQIRTGLAEPRAVTAADVDPEGFWTIAAEAGKRVAALDLPWTVPPAELNGIFLAEWGTHDRWFGTACVPASLVEEIRERHGEYPVGLCDDDYGPSLAERERLAADLLTAVEYETRLVVDYLGREDWDLFAFAYGQFQCVGHNFWGFHEGDSAPESLREAMYRVAAKVDEGIAAIVQAAGPDALTLVVTSHGMGPIRGGRHLLPEVLVRLGAGSGQGSAARIRSRLPFGLRGLIRKLLPSPVRRRLQRAAGSLPAPLASPSTKAIALPGDPNAYVRLNLKGREPNGSIEPGAEAEEALADITRAILELRDPDSGEQIVAGVKTADEAFGSDRHPDLPDLMVQFRADLGVIEACHSERVGLVKAPFRLAHRTGDHTGNAMLWLAGAAVEASSELAAADAVDVAPTLLAGLGVPIPDRLDGRSLLEAPPAAANGAASDLVGK